MIQEKIKKEAKEQYMKAKGNYPSNLYLERSNLKTDTNNVDKVNDLFDGSKNNGEPAVFSKKKSLKNTKPLKFVTNDAGKIRHYPPAAQEWFNSIYTYNKNFIKTLPVLDKNLMHLLKSYYNMGISHKILNIKHRLDRFRRLSPRKVFVGKGEVKHTSSKVIISVYLYNTEKMYLIREIKKQFKYLFLAKAPIMIAYSLDRNGNKIVSHNRPYTLDEFMQTPNESIIRYKKYPLQFQKKILTYREIYLSSITSAVKKITTSLKKINKYYDYLSEIVKKEIITNREKLLIFTYKIPKLNFVKLPEHNDNIELAKWTYWKKLRRSFYLLKFNIVKSDPNFLIKLGNIVNNSYNKEVEFNVVELNQMYLNSDIYTQAVALKLKNRQNSLYWVLRSSLTKVNLPNVSRQAEKFSNFIRDDLLDNKIRNSYISSMLNNTSDKNISKEDSLNKLLLSFYPSSEDLKLGYNSVNSNRSGEGITTWPTDLEIYVLKTLKHLKLAGVRIEAKGRLTKRFTASRSVFKMKYKGGLKNVDSSFKGISAVMLRGIVKSNVQYSFLSSKNRIGSYGVKGWIGNK
jgi:Mitochondrial ribosomal protein (VAR1)